MAKRTRFVTVEDIMDDLEVDDSHAPHEPMLPGSDDELSYQELDSDEGIQQYNSCHNLLPERQNGWNIAYTVACTIVLNITSLSCTNRICN